MFKRAVFASGLLVLLLVFLFEKATAKKSALGELKTRLSSESFSLNSWLNQTFNATVSGNHSTAEKCDKSEQDWADNVLLYFKAITQNLSSLDTPARCTERNESELKYFDISARYEEDQKEYLPLHNYVGLPFRRFGSTPFDFGQRASYCEIFSGTFVKAANNLYFVRIEDYTNHRLEHIPNTTGSRYYVEEDVSFFRRFSLFKTIKGMQNVPGYKSALKEAEGALPEEEDSLQEYSASNNAILFLPVLFSFVPLSLISEETSRIRTILYVIATDLVSNIPILIKGVALLQLSAKATLPLKSVTFKIGSSDFQLAEVWIAQCFKTLPSFRYGSIFLLVGVWAIAIGIVTEYISWKYVLEKEKKMCRPSSLDDEEAMRMLDKASSNQDADKKGRDEYRNEISAAEQTPVTTEDTGTTTSPADEPWEIAFFFYGAILSILFCIPFVTLLLARLKVFKKTEKRKYLFKTGIIVGSLNTTFSFLYILSNPLAYRGGLISASLYSFIFAIIFDIVLVVVLHPKTANCWNRLRKRRSTVQASERIHELDDGVMKFLLFGFLLGLLTSLFSIFYVFCFPGIQGNKRREIFFKYGCMLGAVTSIFMLELGLILMIGSNMGYYVFLYNVFFALLLTIAETEILIHPATVER